jgi:hypothetical protein
MPNSYRLRPSAHSSECLFELDQWDDALKQWECIAVAVDDIDDAKTRIEHLNKGVVEFDA